MDSEVSVLTEVHNTVVEDLSVDLLFCRKDFLIGLYYSLAKYWINETVVIQVSLVSKTPERWLNDSKWWVMIYSSDDQSNRVLDTYNRTDFWDVGSKFYVRS